MKLCWSIHAPEHAGPADLQARSLAPKVGERHPNSPLWLCTRSDVANGVLVVEWELEEPRIDPPKARKPKSLRK